MAGVALWLDAGTAPVLLAAVAVWLLGVAPMLSGRTTLYLSLSGATLLLIVEFNTGMQFTLPLLLLIGGQLVADLTEHTEPTQTAPALRKRPSPAPPPAATSSAPGKPVSGMEDRLRGLELQAKGDLDGAFEAFRKCPFEEPVLESLYKLALAFEQEKRFDRAAVVFGTISSKHPDYRDIKQRNRRAELMVKAAASSQASAAEEGSLVLGRYEVQKELGKGAMGVVYLGRDPTIGRVVAIKTMSFGQELDPDELASVKERFFREAETAGKLTHPHIVTIYDAGEAHGLAWIAMEMLRGHDLNRHIKKDALLPVTTVIEIIAQAAEGLDYAHSHGVIHRDIKPANLVYDRDQRTVKITDFGIARIADSTKTRIGLVLGTPSYMSPEQLRGKELDGRSDIFSLGVTLYQLLTGQLPFRADTMSQLVKSVSEETPMEMSMLRSDLPDEMDAIVARAIAKNPDDRYQRGSDFARVLRALHSEEGELWI